jgi:hypothetical protein
MPAQLVSCRLLRLLQLAALAVELLVGRPGGDAVALCLRSPAGVGRQVIGLPACYKGALQG